MTSAAPALSVLDLVPVRTGQTSAEAIAASLSLAEIADRLGYRRYWFAEHHNMPAVASTTPPVLIAAAASRTERMKLGSGGVMLPNHAPLIVAEQFAALEAIAPGRIDLGLGRAPGSDPVITQLLRTTGTTSDVEQFPRYVQDISLLLSGEGATVRFTSGGEYTVHATPAATSVPDVWLLGSSDYSAQLAASQGLPYVFANHFSGQGLERALDLYRSGYQPSEAHPEPRTFLTVNVVASPSAEEAEARALPQLRMMSRLRLNKPLTALETVEEAIAAGIAEADAATEQVVQAARERWFVGTGESVAAEVRAFAQTHGVNEVMLSPVAGAYDAEPKDSAAGRAQTLELIASAL
ncbi:LLM class flavin-dependent oxidoreductase [Microbacterium sp. AK031]|uniref:LLM class flavin-dependent oxidoreductase n=1 Tax=Microbacterium sp. AK031 TaxID=2723076 RepID=UPI002167E761|nr:LLM class flavin-dependent oxidoreductase [Microbacterium sp. AK031]MCS3843018.1 luciferase family oxidoreductase group 1 [Microbacterium sp. AK031]